MNKGVIEMARYELSISPNYVPSWTLVDAVREIFQNAIDQETTCEDNAMFYDYNEETQKLKIGNKRSVLEASSLLLGATTKANDTSTIGKFGEGYKIATLVLTRLKKSVVFYNYGKREVWRPKFIKSKRYNGTEILVFDVFKNYIWSTTPDNDLTIEISNVSEDEYEQVVESNLHIQNNLGEIIECEKGRILLDERYKGRVFVNGLFVCEYDDYEKGYDFKPKYIKIDRDRKLVSDFDLQWLASQLWCESKSDTIVELAINGAKDVQYINFVASLGTSSYNNISNKAYNDFVIKHGDSAIPVINQSEINELDTNKYKPIVVNTQYKELITSSPLYTEPEVKSPEVTTKDKLMVWMKEIERSEQLYQTQIQEFYDIIDEL